MPPNDPNSTDLAPRISDHMLKVFAAMAAGIPEADDSEAYESILEQVLTAENVDQLNAPWDTDAVAKLAGHNLLIQEMTRRPSDYKGGLGVYLVTKGVDQATGERFVLTNGSISVVAQLARAYFVSGLPILAQVIVGDPSPKTGYRPQHLNVLALANPQDKPKPAAGKPAGDDEPAF